jgi:hypothetical protein
LGKFSAKIEGTELMSLTIAGTIVVTLEDIETTRKTWK